jgi:flagellar hook-associated protein 1 FlgK
MASSFGGINTALTALYAQRRGLDVAGQNVANVNTEGYTRQRAVMQADPGSISASMWARTDGVGAGVGVSSVQRLRDEFLESRGRTEHGQSAYLANQSAAYSTIEDVFNEPSDTALQAQLHDMWAGWSDVANNPDSLAARSSLLEKSRTVVNVLHANHDALAGQWSANRSQLEVYADEVNTTATAIAKLNSSIVPALASGATVSELQDQRDLQVMHLAELAGATTSTRPNGAVDVFIGGSALVSEFTTSEIEVTGAAWLADQAGDPVTVGWKGMAFAAPPGGTMGSVVNTMTNIIPGLSQDLDGVANALASTVNTAHLTAFGLDGVNGRAYFSGTTAETIEVAITNPAQVAASATAGPGGAGSVQTFDGSVADQLSAVGSSDTGPDKTYQNMIAGLGVIAQTSTRRAAIQSNVAEQVDAARAAESGVNIDEEMTNLLTFQRGYEAASRVLTTVDSMLDQLINRTGLVGR